MIPPDCVSIRTAYSRLFHLHSSEASERLAYFLCTGKLRAFYFDRQMEEHSISVDRWQSMSESSRLDIFKTGTALAAEGAETEIVVREDDLAAMLPSRDKAPYADPTQANSITKRGRKPKHDANDVWSVITLTAHDDGFEESQEKMIDKVQRQYEQSFGKDTAPSRTTLQPMIRKLFAERAKKDAKVKAGK